MAAFAKSDEERFEDYIKQFKSFPINLRDIDSYEAFVVDEPQIFHAKGLNQYSDLTIVEYLREVLGRDAIPPDVSWSVGDGDGHELVKYKYGYVRDSKDEDEDEDEDKVLEDGGEGVAMDFGAEGKVKGELEFKSEVDVSVKRQRRECK
ncbi:hypothetical protein Hanom_Chr09g00830351 [Helianthus anomalus]